MIEIVNCEYFSGYIESLGYPDSYYLDNSYCQWSLEPDNVQDDYVR